MSYCRFRISPNCHQANENGFVCAACWRVADEDKREELKVIMPGWCSFKKCWNSCDENHFYCLSHRCSSAHSAHSAHSMMAVPTVPRESVPMQSQSSTSHQDGVTSQGPDAAPPMTSHQHLQTTQAPEAAPSRPQGYGEQQSMQQALAAAPSRPQGRVEQQPRRLHIFETGKPPPETWKPPPAAAVPGPKLWMGSSRWPSGH